MNHDRIYLGYSVARIIGSFYVEKGPGGVSKFILSDEAHGLIDGITGSVFVYEVSSISPELIIPQLIKTGKRKTLANIFLTDSSCRHFRLLDKDTKPGFVP
jgi:hypothetical protein